MTTAAVCFDVETARSLLGQGTAVVLFGRDGDALGRAVAELRHMGRVAAFVGDPAQEADRQAASALAAEQFGNCQET